MMSVSAKRRRATSPSSSASGGGDLDDVSSSTPASVRKRKRISNVPPVDTVVSLAYFTPLCQYVSMFVCVVCAYLFVFFCYRRLLYVTNCLTLSGTTRMSKEGNSVKFS